jgi:hypothetical protein
MGNYFPKLGTLIRRGDRPGNAHLRWCWRFQSLFHGDICVKEEKHAPALHQGLRSLTNAISNGRQFLWDDLDATA